MEQPLNLQDAILNLQKLKINVNMLNVEQVNEPQE